MKERMGNLIKNAWAMTVLCMLAATVVTAAYAGVTNQGEIVEVVCVIDK